MTETIKRAIKKVIKKFLDVRPRKLQYVIGGYDEKPFVKQGGKKYTTEEMVALFMNENIKIPWFQRDFVWTDKEKSDFIVGLLTGYYKSIILIYTKNKMKVYYLLDGLQRLTFLKELLCKDLIIDLNAELKKDYPVMADGKIVSVYDAIHGKPFSEWAEDLKEYVSQMPLRVEIIENCPDAYAQDRFGSLNKGKELNAPQKRKSSISEYMDERITVLADNSTSFKYFKETEESMKKNQKTSEIVSILLHLAKKGPCDITSKEIDKTINSFETDDHSFDICVDKVKSVLDFLDKAINYIMMQEEVKNLSNVIENGRITFMSKTHFVSLGVYLLNHKEKSPLEFAQKMVDLFNDIHSKKAYGPLIRGGGTSSNISVIKRYDYLYSFFYLNKPLSVEHMEQKKYVMIDKT